MHRFSLMTVALPLMLTATMAVNAAAAQQSPTTAPIAFRQRGRIAITRHADGMGWRISAGAVRIGPAYGIEVMVAITNLGPRTRHLHPQLLRFGGRTGTASSYMREPTGGFGEGTPTSTASDDDAGIAVPPAATVILRRTFPDAPGWQSLGRGGGLELHVTADARSGDVARERIDLASISASLADEDDALPQLRLLSGGERLLTSDYDDDAAP